MNAAGSRGAATRLVVAYAAFALLATAANIGAQDAAVRLYQGPGAIAVSIIVGTGVGLAVKYVLDKRYIFRFQARDAVHDGRTFLLYALMGLVTTLIFWGMEAGFQYAFSTKAMRYAGGILGLAVGYAVKYRLDRRYVFLQEAA